MYDCHVCGKTGNQTYKHECNNNTLHVLSEQLNRFLINNAATYNDEIGAIESFAREIRNQVLEEIADYFDNYISLEAHEEHWVAEEIRKFKETESKDDK